MPESVASIDSLSLASDDSSYDTEEEILAEQEWNESVEQLQQLMSLVLLPYLGKWFGRKCSYWRKSPLTSIPTSEQEKLIMSF